MKGKLAAVAFFTAMGIASSAMATDGTVEFTGKIIDAGCEIDTAATDATVKLGEVAKTAFTAAGSNAATTEFKITLTNCPAELAGKPVSLKYDATPDASNNDYIQVTGGASGVAIQLLNDDATELPLGTASNSKNLADSGSTELNFFARYISTVDASAIVSGDANGTANFTLTYN